MNIKSEKIYLIIYGNEKMTPYMEINLVTYEI